MGRYKERAVIALLTSPCVGKPRFHGCRSDIDHSPALGGDMFGDDLPEVYGAVIAGKDDTVIGGHARYLILKKVRNPPPLLRNGPPSETSGEVRIYYSLRDF